jgi:hypothetical protein
MTMSSVASCGCIFYVLISENYGVLDRELELIRWLSRLPNECIYACSFLEWSEQQHQSFLQETEAAEKLTLTSLLTTLPGS